MSEYSAEQLIHLMKRDENTETVGTDVSALVGRTIIAAHREPPSGKDYELGEETLTLTLDDGTIWTFEGTGYDASSLIIEKRMKDSEA